jgi:hypothetical protein
MHVHCHVIFVTLKSYFKLPHPSVKSWILHCRHLLSASSTVHHGFIMQIALHCIEDWDCRIPLHFFVSRETNRQEWPMCPAAADHSYSGLPCSPATNERRWSFVLAVEYQTVPHEELWDKPSLHALPQNVISRVIFLETDTIVVHLILESMSHPPICSPLPIFGRLPHEKFTLK